MGGCPFLWQSFIEIWNQQKASFFWDFQVWPEASISHTVHSNGQPMLPASFLWCLWIWIRMLTGFRKDVALMSWSMDYTCMCAFRLRPRCNHHWTQFLIPGAHINVLKKCIEYLGCICNGWLKSLKNLSTAVLWWPDDQRISSLKLCSGIWWFPFDCDLWRPVFKFCLEYYTATF